MKTIAEPIFLTWAADGGLVPDPRYPASRQQLVFVDAPDCWRPWSCPTTPAETAAFVGAAVGIVGRDQPWRVRLRGGGQFAPTLPLPKPNLTSQPPLQPRVSHRPRAEPLNLIRQNRARSSNLLSPSRCLAIASKPTSRSSTRNATPACSSTIIASSLPSFRTTRSWTTSVEGWPTPDFRARSTDASRSLERRPPNRLLKLTTAARGDRRRPTSRPW
jgi:hypothetical protein